MMKKDTHRVQTGCIQYTAPREVRLGDVFYKVEPKEHQVFHELCLVCKGARKLTINGVTFQCPCCGNMPEVLRICNFIVRRYRVYVIEQEADSTDWKPSARVVTRFHAYRKYGHGQWGVERSTIRFGEQELCERLNPAADLLNGLTSTNYIFDDYKLAVAAAKYLTAQELRKLEEYNAKHGTAYAAEFKLDHDRPSK